MNTLIRTLDIIYTFVFFVLNCVTKTKAEKLALVSIRKPLGIKDQELEMWKVP
jgi:hypothetical protein